MNEQNKEGFVTTPVEAAEMVKRLREVATVKNYTEGYLRECLLESADLMESLQRQVEKMEAALGQASFCLRIGMPHYPDAQMTVKMIEAARIRPIAESPHKSEV